MYLVRVVLVNDKKKMVFYRNPERQVRSAGQDVRSVFQRCGAGGVCEDR